MSGATGSGRAIVDINVTPLVDVLLVLMVVLMVSASAAVSRSLAVDLPEASMGEHPSEPVLIELSASGLLAVAGSPLSPGALRARLRAQPAPPAVVLAADGSVSHRELVAILDLLAQEQVLSVAIAVRPARTQ